MALVIVLVNAAYVNPTLAGYLMTCWTATALGIDSLSPWKYPCKELASWVPGLTGDCSP